MHATGRRLESPLKEDERTTRLKAERNHITLDCKRTAKERMHAFRKHEGKLSKRMIEL